MKDRLINTFCLGVLIFHSMLFAYPGTGGAPLGGMGTGYIKFDATTGSFKRGGCPHEEHMPGGRPGYREWDNNSAFHFYVKVGDSISALEKVSSTTEDAKIPLYTADFGSIQKVNVTLQAFAPLNSGDEKLSSLPLAFFEFFAENTNSTQAEVAVAFDFDNNFGGTGPSHVENGITWTGDNNVCVLADYSIHGQATSGQSKADFFEDGLLDNSDGNILASKIVIPAGVTASVRFVAAWHLRWEYTNDFRKYHGEGYYYYNHFDSSSAVARYGIENFEQIRNSALEVVDRTTAVNLPSWYTDRLLNNLYPLIHNAQMAEDGRVAFIEGKYNIIGTIDQQGHAQIPMSFMWPGHNWRQMEFWARTQYQSPADLVGQIHHDFNGMKTSYLCQWDDWQHDDYPYGGDKTTWADLNAMFIISVYEIFLATGDKEKLDSLWTAVTNTAGRIIRMCRPQRAPADSYLPYGTHSSYDRHGGMDLYNSSLVLVAYAAMSEMALAMGDSVKGEEWSSVFSQAKTQFKERFTSENGFGSQEHHLAGYPFARSLGLPSIVDDSIAHAAFDSMYSAYDNGNSTGFWHFYTVGHFADLGIAIGETDKGLQNHHADFLEYYQDKPHLIHWQDLDHEDGYYSYMTAPVVWRSLLLITGYLFDNYNKRLWIRPSLPSSVNKHLTNAPLVLPGNWGTLDYYENENSGVFSQRIEVSWKNPVECREIVLKNPLEQTGPHVVVKQGAVEKSCSVVTGGSGHDAVIRITLDSPILIDNSGIEISVNASPTPSQNSPAETYHARQALEQVQIDYPFVILPAPAKLRIDLIALNGKKVLTANSKMYTAGKTKIKLPESGANVLPAGFYVLRITEIDKNDKGAVVLNKVFHAVQ
ncbi:MAG: hypothetical protein GF350_00585 [Chitinivibrionales bacterium]|nr:hypothetical protein [Chitinivibrionales bacterium]